MQPSQRSCALRLLAGLLLGAAFSAPVARAQGCAQCRDNAAAASPATQRAYRRAIVLMSVAGGGFFLGTLALFRRNPRN